MTKEKFPALPYSEWHDTLDTLHLYAQIPGKIRLELAPRKNHWWFAMLYLTSRGYGTSPIPYKDRSFEIDFDFIDHKLIIRTSDGDISEFALEDGLSVADFYNKIFTNLGDLDIDVDIIAKPYGVPMKEPFASDTTHKSYDKEYVRRYWDISRKIDAVFKEFSGRFRGKVSPVHLFWHSFDLAAARFSGKRLPETTEWDIVARDAYSDEVISAGFWPGDESAPDAAFYSYTFPEPAGIQKEGLQPSSAIWTGEEGNSRAILRYEDMRKEDNPEQALLDFLESSYLAGAKLAGWDIENFKVRPLI